MKKYLSILLALVLSLSAVAWETPDPMYEHMYVIGDLCNIRNATFEGATSTKPESSWELGNGVEMQKKSDGVFEIKVKVLKNSYFGFNPVLNCEDWGEWNTTRLSPVSGLYKAQFGANPMTVGGNNSWMLETGKYTFTIDCNTGIFYIEGEEIDFEPTEFQYTYEGQTLTYTVLDEEAKTVETKIGAYSSAGNDVSGDLIIPAIAKDADEEYTVVALGDYAFNGCSSLTSVEIPNSVTIIGYGAFIRCSDLTSVEIPNSVTSIGNYAFSGCSSLTSVEIPNSVTSIVDSAFESCRSLTSVEIPNSVTSIGDYAFRDCRNLTSVVIPNSVTSIGHSAFSGCRNLTLVEIPSSVTSIDSYAFSGCSSLTSVEIPNSVTYIGEEAFSGCSSLTSVEISNSVTTIGEGPFSYCEKLMNINVADENTKYKSINGILYDKECTTLIQVPGALTSVEIPNSVTSIGYAAFAGCHSLTSVGIPNSVTSISDYAFNGCSSLTSVVIPYSVTDIGEDAFAECSSLTSVEITNSVTSIGSYAFAGCSSLTSVEIPGSIEKIGSHAFHESTALVDIFYNTTDPISADKNIFSSYTYQNATLHIPAETDGTFVNVSPWNNFNKILAGGIAVENPNSPLFQYTYEGKTLWYNILDRETKTVELRAGTNEAGGNDIDGDLIIPSIAINGSTEYSVKSIGDYAFAYCRNLTSVKIPDSVDIIGDYAFGACDNLTSVEIPNSISYIRTGVFMYCYALDSLDIPNSVCYIYDRAFAYCTSLTSIKLPNSVSYIDDYTFAYCNSLKSIKLPNSLEIIGDGAFLYCTELEHVEIPNTVTYIGDTAFGICSSLTSVEIPNSVTSIEPNTFANCSSLASVVIPSSVTSIGYGAFGKCTELKSVYMKSSNPPALGEFAFDNCCDELTVIVPNGAVDAYKAAPVWADYNIVCMTPYLANDCSGDVLFYEANSMSGIQFDVELPEGVEFAIGEEAAALMSVNSSAVEGNKTRYVAYTNNGEMLPVAFIGTAVAGKAERGSVKISNIILSVNDNPVTEADFEIPVLGYSLEGLTVPDVKTGATVYLDKPAEIGFEDVTVGWKPYSSELGELTSDGCFTAKAAGTIEDLGLTIFDPLVSMPIEAMARVMIYLMGDADCSGAIDIADVVAVVNYILMRNPEPFDFNMADMDGSGDINIADLTRLVKLVLAQPKAAMAEAPARARNMSNEMRLDVQPASLTEDGKQHIYVSFDTDREYTAMQVDLALPESGRIANISTGSAGHTLDYAAIDNTTTRIILYSAGLAALPRNERLIDVTLDEGNIPDNSRVSATAAISADAEGRSFSHSPVEAELFATTTGVAEAMADGVSVRVENGTIFVEAPAETEVGVFDIQGRKVGAWQGCGSVAVEAGVYIVRTGNSVKKIAVK